MSCIVSLEQFLATDGITLPGLLYHAGAKSVALFLHGCGDSSIFYSAERMNTLGTVLSSCGISFFPFNNRGAYVRKGLSRVLPDRSEVEVTYGTGFELIRECEYDIDGAVRFLRTRGFEQFYLIGHSSGANKICVYNYYHRDNPFAKLVLLGGGDDSGLYYQEWGDEKFHRVLDACRAAIQKGDGLLTVTPDIFSDIYSYQSLFDVINPEGDYNVFPYYYATHHPFEVEKKMFREFASLTQPTLVVYGENDPYASIPVSDALQLLKEHAVNSSAFTYTIIAAADHSFHGKVDELASSIVLWLT
jgi:pimeloyl-ACP methyl ester carboxylesterase